MQLVGNGVRVTLLRSGLHYRFWGYALVTWCRDFNCTSVNPESEKTPYEEYRGRAFAGTVIPFGPRVFFLEHNQEKKDERLKFESKSKDGVFLGYAQYGGMLVLDVAAFRD